ncbi:flagellar hook protein FlgE [Hydrogenivirga caldilitoris]|uniref:Flagellar hook protein FlgE n=1 Tax=Hydrogenivirga caldilitoris TaxID=246264 RepID=A0A497XRG7_9AQUI|nr:flagellar hook protein FlgE [Hydrogenivirga caldilitoris]RLJ71528.1 flagellar hook protein FlgE [Hydrogenivirga caldilitoris]
MLRSFFNAVTGMDASRFWIDVTSDNLSNVNTVAFKAQRPLFQDVISSVTIGLNVVTGTIKSTTYGAGVIVDSTQKFWTIGNFKQTGVNTDLAIQGRGLFILKDPITGANLYTRDGQFRLSREGYMVNSGGFYLQGFRLNEKGEVVGTGLENIHVEQQLQPRPTGQISFLQPTNLNAEAIPPTAAFDPTNTTSYNYKYTMTIYDSLGNEYQADIYFKKDTATNTWRIFALSDYDGDGNLENLISDSYRSGFETSGGNTYNYQTIVFDAATGKIDEDDTQTANAAAFNVVPVGNKNYFFLQFFDTANPPSDVTGAAQTLDTSSGGTLGSTVEGLTTTPGMIFTIGDELTSDTDTNLIQNSYANQFASDFVVTMEQNGYAKGDLIDVYVLSEDGSVVAVYSNGKSLPLYRVAVAVFADPEELTKKGANLYTSITTPTILLAGGAEKVRSGMLEMSNVDIAKEFINLITAQRAYQANARVITTANTILDETVNIVR